MTGHDILAKAMSEDDLMGHIARLCRDLGLLAYHTHDSRRSRAGFPDWAIVGPGGLLFRECKDEARKPTLEQEKWLAALRAAGQDAGLWRPSDLLAGRELRWQLPGAIPALWCANRDVQRPASVQVPLGQQRLSHIVESATWAWSAQTSESDSGERVVRPLIDNPQVALQR